MPASPSPVPSPAAPPAPPAIVAESLSKSFGLVRAVERVSFSISPGQLVAFLGPNGAGKSTTMRMLTGFLSPTSGKARIAGIDVMEERVEAARRIGYLPENGPLYGDATPLGLLSFLGRARGMRAGQIRERIGVVVEQCRLAEVASRPIGTLSKGFRQRVGMAGALLHDPDVLILDEPTAGLDPNQVDQVRQLLKSLARQRTVLLSTHILSEVRAVADRILLVSRGRLVHDGPGGSLGDDEKAMEDRFRRLTQAA
ncbi:MAG: ABC transporter ATP-binding protein [Phycisphaerales bacterium]